MASKNKKFVLDGLIRARYRLIKQALRSGRLPQDCKWEERNRHKPFHCMEYNSLVLEISAIDAAITLVKSAGVHSKS